MTAIEEQTAQATTCNSALQTAEEGKPKQGSPWDRFHPWVALAGLMLAAVGWHAATVDHAVGAAAAQTTVQERLNQQQQQIVDTNHRVDGLDGKVDRIQHDVGQVLQLDGQILANQEWMRRAMERKGR